VQRVLASWQLRHLGDTSDFAGSILATTSITLNTGATVNGRALAINGAVTMDDNTITVPTCLLAPPPVVTTTPPPWPGDDNVNHGGNDGDDGGDDDDDHAYHDGHVGWHASDSPRLVGHDHDAPSHRRPGHGRRRFRPIGIISLLAHRTVGPGLGRYIGSLDRSSAPNPLGLEDPDYVTHPALNTAY